jgi:hypothetical protein
MKKEKIQKDILVLAIFTFLTATTWIIFDVYRALTKTKIPTVLKEQITPLDPSIDRDLLFKLKSRTNITADEFNLIKEKPSETSTPSASP